MIFIVIGLFLCKIQTMKKTLIILLSTISLSACQSGKQNDKDSTKDKDSTQINPADANAALWFEGEKHLKNVRQLTFGGDNAEAYFSFDNKMLVMQITNPAKGIDCDQIFYGEIPESADEKFELHPISNGQGRTTCSYFMPGDTTIIYASTFKADSNCPQVPVSPDSNDYVWPIFNTFEIYIADLDGNILQQLTDNNYYDAEATVSPKGDKIVFTSNRSGDLELFTMNLDGSDVTQITNQLGYDGGAFFSPDGSKLIFRASRPKTEAEVSKYNNLMAMGLVAPTNMELMICNADGSDLHQITHLGQANWAPFFAPSGNRIIFSTNHDYDYGFPFDLYMINTDGTDLERITFDSTFDAFPMFSFDGKKLVFSSNRNNGGGHDTNLFIADWVE